MDTCGGDGDEVTLVRVTVRAGWVMVRVQHNMATNLHANSINRNASVFNVHRLIESGITN